MSLILRNEKGSQLTFNEMDGNFTYLEELSQTGSFTGSFIGDGSGLTGIPGVTPIDTGSFATTGSNQFNGEQSISGSTTISGSLLQGAESITSGIFSHAEGQFTTASGNYSHVEGVGTITSAEGSHAEGTGSIAAGNYSHAEGQNTYTVGQASHAEGLSSRSFGNYSHAEGWESLANANYAHAEGRNTSASANYSHAEGWLTKATGQGAHAEGQGSEAKGSSSHAEGSYTISSGSYSHAEGQSTKSVGMYSHAEGQLSEAQGEFSHAEGYWTIASGSYSHTQGAYNIALPNDYAFIIGNGTADNSRSNLVFASGSQFQITGSLLVTGSARLTGGVTGSSFTGSFVGDGSGLTGIPGVTPINTSSFATTGSNVFVGNQTISGSVSISGSVRLPGSGSFRDFINGVPTVGGANSIKGNGPGLFNIIEQGDTGITFAVSKITTNDLTSAITSNLSGANNGNYSDAQPTTSGVGRGARLMFTIAGGVVTSVRIFDVANGNNNYEEHGQPANRQGIGYKAGDTLTVAAGTGGIGGTGNLVITLRPQDIETYLGYDHRLTFDYDDTRTLRVAGDIISTTNLTIGTDDDTSEFYVSNNGNNSIVAGVGVTAGSDTGGSIVTGYYNTTNYQGTAVFGIWNTASEGGQTVVGLASNTTGIGLGAFIIGNGADASNKSNLLVAQGNTVQVTGSFQVTGSANITGEVTASAFLGDASYTTSGRWTVGANGNSDYTFTGIGFLSTTNDPILYLARGRVYEFVITSGGSHPFQIRLSNGGAAYNDGVTNNTATSGVVRFEIPFNAPNTLYYQCINHSEMGNVINVYPSI